MAAINDHISNLLTRLRNAQTARFEQLELPSTNILQNIAQILKEEGFIKGFRVVADPTANRLRISLKSSPDTGYAIKGIRRVSRPGRRVYVGKDDIPTVKNGFGIAILSTSKGVMTGEKAKKLSIGGELLCEVW
ncbi:MAG TPA: 30S ribosomal protein S8 [Candidatus Deferrimicrobiaceae bacterium]